MQQRGINLPYGSERDPPGHTSVCALGNLKLDKFRDLLKAKGFSMIRGATELIQDLHNHGVGVGCVSSSKNGAWMLRESKLQSMIDHLIDGNVGNELNIEWKPEAAFFSRCAQSLGAARIGTVVVLESPTNFAKMPSSSLRMLFASGTQRRLMKYAPQVPIKSFRRWEGVTTEKLDAIIGRDRQSALQK